MIRSNLLNLKTQAIKVYNEHSLYSLWWGELDYDIVSACRSEIIKYRSYLKYANINKRDIKP